MMSHQSNDELFAGRNNPTRKLETAGAWWALAPRDGFTKRAEAKHMDRMNRSPEARHTSSIIVGHTGRTR